LEAHLVDVRGVRCPDHIKFLMAKIRQLEPGEVVELLTRDPEVELDVQTWLSRTGHIFKGSVHEEGAIRIYVAKKLGSARDAAS